MSCDTFIKKFINFDEVVIHHTKQDIVMMLKFMMLHKINFRMNYA